VQTDAILLPCCATKTDLRCFGKWQSTFVPTLYRKSKKRSASLNESLDSGTVGRKSNNVVSLGNITEEKEPPEPPPDKDESKPPIEEPPSEEPPVKEPSQKNH
jgi:hypothetical protein